MDVAVASRKKEFSENPRKSRFAGSVPISAHLNRPLLHPDPGFKNFYKACKKGESRDRRSKSCAALAIASGISGLPRDNLDVHEISKEGAIRAKKEGTDAAGLIYMRALDSQRYATRWILAPDSRAI